MTPAVSPTAHYCCWARQRRKTMRRLRPGFRVGRGRSSELGLRVDWEGSRHRRWPCAWGIRAGVGVSHLTKLEYEPTTNSQEVPQPLQGACVESRLEGQRALPP